MLLRDFSKWLIILILFFASALFLFSPKYAQAAEDFPRCSQDVQGNWHCEGFVNREYGPFRATAFDPGDRIFYTFFWDDGSQSTYPSPAGGACAGAGYVNSGVAGTANHTWSSVSPAGSPFRVQATATDCDGESSDRSNIVNATIYDWVNLSIDKDGPSSASPGDEISYTITYTVQNSVPGGEAIGLEVRDTPIGGGSIISANPNWSRAQGATRIWEYATRSPGTYTINVTLRLNSTTINRVQISALNADSDSFDKQIFVGEAWLQTEWGDVHSDGAITNEEPGGRDSATYMVTAGSSITDFSSEQGSDWELENYNTLWSFYPKVDIDGLIAGDYGERKNTNINEWMGSDDPLVTKPLWRSDDPNRDVWYRSGDLSIANNKKDLFLERCGTIVVEGDLRIRGNTYYDPNFNCGSLPGGVDCREALPNVGLVVTGDLNIDDDVTHIVGNYYVLGIVNTGDSDERLMVEGSLIADTFNLERDYVEDNDSAEWMRFDGRSLVNPPPGFLDPAAQLPSWTQIKP